MKKKEKKSERKAFFIHIIISSPFPLVKRRTKNAIIIKNSYKLFKLNKKATFFCLLFITLRAVESNMRGLFIIVYGHSTSDCDATHVFTQKRAEEEKTEQTPCSMLMTIHVKLKPWETPNRTILKK